MNATSFRVGFTKCALSVVSLGGDPLSLNETEVSEAFRLYGHLVKRRCQRIVRLPSAADDVVQEVFLRLWRYGDSFRVAESKVAWLYRVAERCAYDQLDRRQSQHTTLSEGLPDLGGSQPHQISEDGEIVLRFLQRFDERIRQVALHHYLDEMTQEEIAHATGRSRQTIVKKLAILREEAARLKSQLWKR